MRKEQLSPSDSLLVDDLDCIDQLSLGARGDLPSGYMVSSLWVLKQFAQPIFTGYRVNTFEKSSAQCPVGTL